MSRRELMDPFVVLIIIAIALAYVNSPIRDALISSRDYTSPDEVGEIAMEYPLARDGDLQLRFVSSVTPYSRGDWWGYGFDVPYFKRHLQEPRGCSSGTCVFYPGPAYGDFKDGQGYTGYGPGTYGYDYPAYRPPIYAPPPGAALPRQALATRWISGYELRLTWVDSRMVQSVRFEVMDQYGNVFSQAVVTGQPFVAIMPVPAEAARIRAVVTYTDGFSANVYPVPR